MLVAIAEITAWVCQAHWRSCSTQRWGNNGCCPVSPPYNIQIWSVLWVLFQTGVAMCIAAGVGLSTPLYVAVCSSYASCGASQ